MWVCPHCERNFRRKNQSHSCKSVHSIDEYIASSPKEHQAKLQELRKAIREAAPEAKEKISWNMPTFVQNGNIGHFALHQKHIGFHAGATAVTAFENELDHLHHAKGTIRLPHDKPLPKQLIKKIIQFNVARKNP